MSFAVLCAVPIPLLICFVAGSSELWCARLPAAEKLPWLVRVCLFTVLCVQLRVCLIEDGADEARVCGKMCASTNSVPSHRLPHFSNRCSAMGMRRRCVNDSEVAMLDLLLRLPLRTGQADALTRLLVCCASTLLCASMESVLFALGVSAGWWFSRMTSGGCANTAS